MSETKRLLAEMQEKANARKQGMTVEEFRAAKAQVKAARTRGKRPAGQKADRLSDWGTVDGQASLF
jgi:hypothetical protein